MLDIVAYGMARDALNLLEDLTEPGKNLFDGNYWGNTVLTGSLQTPGYLEYRSAGGYVAVIPVKGGRTYAISKSPDTNRFRLVWTIEKPRKPKPGERIPLDGVYFLQWDDGSSVVRTLPPEANWLIVYVSDSTENKKPEWLQVEEGDVPTEYEPYTRVIRSDKISAKGGLRFLADRPSGDVDINTRYVDYLAYDWQEVYDIYDQLANDYPEYVTRSLLCEEEAGLPVYLYEFKPPGVTSTIVYTSGAHGNEPGAVYGTALFFETLCKDWRTNDVLRALRWNFRFVVIPVLNPWGFQRALRKNSVGIDLNRNFPSGWTYEPDPESPYYAGSEPLEAIAAQKLYELMELEEDVLFAIDHHNFNHYVTDRVFWLGTNDDELRGGLVSVARLLYGQVLQQHEIPSGAAYSVTTSVQGGIANEWAKMGKRGLIFETVNKIWQPNTEENKKEGQKMNINLVGNLLAALIRFYTR